MSIKYNEHFVSFLRMSSKERRVAWIRSRVLQWGGIALAWVWLVWLLMLLRPVAFTSGSLPHSYSPPTILSLLWVVFIALFMPLITLTFSRIVLPNARFWIGAEITRQALFTGDTRLSVVADDQPKPLESGELPPDASHFSALKYPSTHVAISVLTDIIVLINVAGVSFITYRWFTSSLDSFGSQNDIIDLTMALLPLLTGGHGVILQGLLLIVPDGWWVFFPGRRRKVLAVDDWGIRWRERRWRTREHTLAWADVSAFCVEHSLKSLSYQYTFLLLGQQESFAWTKPLNAKEHQRAVGELLARLVVTRTRLPLLDVSKTISYAERMPFPFDATAPHKPEKASPSAMRFPILTRLLGDKATQVRVKQGLAEGYAALERAAAPRRLRILTLDRRIFWIDLALVIIVAFGFCGLWMVDQQRSDAYARTIPALIANEAPLFSDSLNAPSGNWPVYNPTSNDIDTISKQYAYGGYALTGGQKNYDIEQMYSARAFADVAVAVTVRQIGEGDYDGVGIIVVNGDGGMATFTVSPERGTWTLFYVTPGQFANPEDDWHYDGGGNDNSTNTIHTGANAVNRLLLVMRHGQYLGYINDQLVAISDISGATTSGHLSYIGLDVEDNTTTGVFNDFAVYPAPPPYQPLLHG
jgi:hypothetical protein